MNDSAVIEKIESLVKTVKRLETRIESLETQEDLRDLEKAISDSGDRPLVPWDQAKAHFDMD